MAMRATHHYWTAADLGQLDPETRTLTVSRPGTEDVVTEVTYSWRPLLDAAPCDVHIAALFA